MTVYSQLPYVTLFHLSLSISLQTAHQYAPSPESWRIHH